MKDECDRLYAYTDELVKDVYDRLYAYTNELVKDECDRLYAYARIGEWMEAIAFDIRGD